MAARTLPRMINLLDCFLSYQPTDKVIKAGGGAVDSVCYVLYNYNYFVIINPRPEGYGSRFVVHSFINPRPEGYGSRFVILSIYLSICQPRYREQRSRLRAS